MTEKKQNTDAIKSPKDDCISTNVYENNLDIACSRLSSYSINDDKTDFSNKINSPKANNFQSKDLQNRSKSCVSYINSNVSYKNNDDDIKSTLNDSSASLQLLFHNGYYGKFDTRFQPQGYKYAYSKLIGYDNVDIDVVRRKSKVKICSNCQTQETPSWRRSMDRKSLLCNACGLYQRLHNRPRPFFKNFDGKTRAIKPTSYVYICHCCNKVSKMSWKRTLDGKQICNYCSFFNKDILYGNGLKQHIPFRASRFNFAFDRNKSSNSYKTSHYNHNFQLHSVSDNCYQNNIYEPYDQDAGLGQIPQVDVDNTDGIYEGLKDYRNMDMYRLSEEYNSQNKSDTDDYEYFEDQMTPRSFKKSF